MFGTGVHLNLPPASYFTLPPDSGPWTLPPPSGEHTLRSPFTIDPTFYNDALDIKVPVTVAATYFVTAYLLNQANKRNNYKPWRISQTTPFYIFQILHNVFLALYSLVTFVAMLRAILVSTPNWSQHGLPGLVDALCSIQGPRGYGDAVTYDSSALKWGARNSLIHLDPSGKIPDPTDVGRLWNEGLAFWGWLFYLSKLYEVVDTLIVLMKGKRATTLQVFHHIGAMFCLWAGIGYMSPPIWMFVIVNSFIHTLMYTFYTATTLGFKVPSRVKRTITTMQIIQLMWGVVYAGLHLFVSYNVPVSKPYKIVSMLAHPAVATEAASDLLSNVTQAGLSTGQIPAWVKRLMYRAVGAEGLAESVRDSSIYTDRRAAASRDRPSGTDPYKSHESSYSTRSSNQYEVMPCLDTDGQAFAVWLNVVYLAPLIVLFVRFFVKSYTKKAGKSTQPITTAEGRRAEGRRLSESVNDAAKATSDVVESVGSQGEDLLDSISQEISKTAEVGGKKVKEASETVKKSRIPRKGDPSKKEANDAETTQNQDTSSSSHFALEDSFVKVRDQVREGAKSVTGVKGGGDVKKEQESKSAATKEESGSRTTTSTTSTSSPSKSSKKNKKKAKAELTEKSNGGSDAVGSEDEEVDDGATFRSTSKEETSSHFRGTITEGNGEIDVERSHPASYGAGNGQVDSATSHPASYEDAISEDVVTTANADESSERVMSGSMGFGLDG